MKLPQTSIVVVLIFHQVLKIVEQTDDSLMSPHTSKCPKNRHEPQQWSDMHLWHNIKLYNQTRLTWQQLVLTLEPKVGS